MKKRIVLNLSEPHQIAIVGKALSSELRMEILKLLVERACNVSEIASHFAIPLSSAALHIKALEEAGMILAQETPGVRGTQKLCGIAFEDIYLDAFAHRKAHSSTRKITIPMPIGNYFDCQISPPCGVVSENAYLGFEDLPYSFYSSERTSAQLIWFESGYLEYRFPTGSFRNSRVSELKFTFEICSEAPGYNNDWPSDITIWIDHQEIATIRSSGDYGDHRGRYNPEWWSDSQTQYGILNTVTINNQGSFENAIKCSDLTLSQLNLENNCYLSFQIGVKPDAANVGGLNLFGEKFGDHPQAILMTLKLEDEEGGLES